MPKRPKIIPFVTGLLGKNGAAMIVAAMMVR
jgi:hypothetical protein